MEITIEAGGQDISEACRLQDTRISYDLSRRVSTAQITAMGRARGEISRYDEARYDVDYYGVNIYDHMPVIIRDRNTGEKLFAGEVTAFDLELTGGRDIQVFYKCDLNDYSQWVDRAVAWGDPADIPMPTSDQELIRRLFANFVPDIDATDVALLEPSIAAFEWIGKTVRQCMEDICRLTMGEWLVDYDAKLHYKPTTAAPAAPFRLSSYPDPDNGVYEWTLTSYKRDFSNPVNACFVRGGWAADGITKVAAWYRDPVAIDEFGREFQLTIVDESITDPYDAQLRAKATVTEYAYPVEQGNFTIWGRDGLKCGQKIRLTQAEINLDADYIIRSLSMHWEDNAVVRYDAAFGRSQPDLETFLRVLEQRTRWASNTKQWSTPSPGSVTDESIADSGLHADSIKSIDGKTLAIGSVDANKIGSVNASSITVGKIQGGQIENINANTIVAGKIQGTQIENINASTVVVGKLQGNQIENINAAEIKVGVIVSDQLADRIIDNLAKYAEALRPIQVIAIGDPWPPAMPNDNFPPNSYFYYEPNGHFYKIRPDGTYWDDVGTSPADLTGEMKFYHVGKISAQSITGLILAGQIDTINAGDIVGGIEAGQIHTIDASTITVGQLQSGQIGSVNATAISVGKLQSNQIGSIDAATITVGKIQGSQIQNIDASTITIGSLQGSRVENINAGTITIGKIEDGQLGQNITGGHLAVGTIDSSKLNATEILVGGGGNRPGKFTVTNAAGAVIGYIGNLDGANYGGWFSVFGAGGTGYTTAKVYTNTAGNLFIKDADFQINSGAYKIYSSTTTFDSTYSTIAWMVDGGGQKTSLISRGVVIYEGATKVGALVRSPTGAYLDLECTTGGYILLSGQTGVVRADGGFKVGANDGYSTEVVVVASNGQHVHMKWTKGILYSAAIVP